MLVLIIGSTLGFVIFNLGFLGKKRGVFLGDSGSNLIGFWVAWIAVYASQNQNYFIEPITMLWFISIPLLDCVGLIFSRIKKGLSWSTAGRDHIHHKLMKKFTSRQTLIIILAITFITGLFGIFIEIIASSVVSSILFLTYAIMYYVLTGFVKIKHLTNN